MRGIMPSPGFARSAFRRQRLQALRFAPILALASLTVPLVAGCSSWHVVGSRGSSNAAPSDNFLRVAMRTEPTTFDPDLVQDGDTIDLLQQTYEGLVMWTPENKLAPALAKSWEISKDGLTYTFHLRPGVKFQSGKPFTSADVVYSFTRGLSPKLQSPVALTYMSDIVGAPDFAAGKVPTLTGIKAIDPMTVQVKISKPKAYWLNVLTYPTAYILNSDSISKDAGGALTAANADGTGAFSIDKYDQGSEVDLKANPSYWGGAPLIAGQRRPILTDANTRHSEYLSGQLDITDESTGALDADLANPQLKDQVKFWPRAATWYISLGEQAEPLFKNPLIRQAFAYATDKNRIVQVVFDGRRDVAQDILPEGIPGWSKSFQGIPYDPAKAKALMAQAGYPGGKGFPTLQMSYRESFPDVAKTVDQLRGMYAQNLGVTIQPAQTEWGVMLDREDHHTLPIYHIRWSADYLDPQDYYSVLFRTGAQNNKTSYSNPSLDKILDAADVQQNPAQRAAMYRQAARVIADDVPVIPVYYQKDPELVKPYVSGIDDSLMGHLPYKHIKLASK